MKFTIIITSLNIEEYIRESIESALTQNFDDYEVIVVDNNSSDDTLKIIKEYEDRLKIVVNKENRGAGGARNAGFDVATRRIHIVFRWG